MFGATPAQLRCAFKKPLQEKYFCTDCKQPIEEGAYMHTDMAKPAEGWRHFICPLIVEKKK